MFEWVFRILVSEEMCDQFFIEGFVDGDVGFDIFSYNESDIDSLYDDLSEDEEVLVGFVEWFIFVNDLFFWISGKLGFGKSILMKFLF